MDKKSNQSGPGVSRPRGGWLWVEIAFFAVIAVAVVYYFAGLGRTDDQVAQTAAVVEPLSQAESGASATYEDNLFTFAYPANYQYQPVERNETIFWPKDAPNELMLPYVSLKTFPAGQNQVDSVAAGLEDRDFSQLDRTDMTIDNHAALEFSGQEESHFGNLHTQVLIVQGSDATVAIEMAWPWEDKDNTEYNLIFENIKQTFKFK